MNQLTINVETGHHSLILILGSSSSLSSNCFSLILLKLEERLKAHQKRASDSITDGCEPPCGCWDLNSGPSQEQSLLLTAEPSLQPRFISSYWLDSLVSTGACGQIRLPELCSASSVLGLKARSTPHSCTHFKQFTYLFYVYRYCACVYVCVPRVA